MGEQELSANEIEYLAWRLLAAILEYVSGDVIVADLHPGQGQYDCLSLVSLTPKPLIMLNRNGSSASTTDGHVENIWERAVREGVHETAMEILSQSRMGINLEKHNVHKDLILTCRRMARWIRFRSDKRGKAICCWIDDTYYVGPATSLLSGVVIPDAWKNQDDPYPNSDWSAWLFGLTIDEKVVGLVNMKTGDAIQSDGSKMERWYEPLAAEPKLRVRTPEIITLPSEIPDEEILNLFRKVSRFNGYEVFGDKLAELSSEIATEWEKNGSLPEELEKLQGALFFESRRARFTDSYPKGRELNYIKALARAIDAAEVNK
jgi:hypothetical protein